MANNHDKRPLTQIDLLDALARDATATENGVRAQISKSVADHFTPKRLKKKHDPTKSTEVRQQLTPSDADLMTVAPLAPKSPWQTYNKLFDLQMGDKDYFAVAEKKSLNVEGNSVVIIKTFTGPKAESRVQAILGIQHNRFVNTRLVFAEDDGYLVSFEFMPLALCEVANNPLLDDLRMASIVGQIIDGLLYLEQESLEHSQLTCSNILIDFFSNVKLWGQEYIRGASGTCPHAKAVGEIIMYLAHGQEREDGSVGLDDPQRFPLTFEFLSAAQTTSKIASIAREPLLELPWHKERVAGLVVLTNTWVGSGYRFPAEE